MHKFARVILIGIVLLVVFSCGLCIIVPGRRGRNTSTNSPATPTQSHKVEGANNPSSTPAGMLIRNKNGDVVAVDADGKELTPSNAPANATFDKRERRNAAERELAQVKRDLASVEDTLNSTRDFGDQAGSPKKALYLNALQRKGELQRRRTELERKLKSMP